MGDIVNSFSPIGDGARSKWAATCTLTGAEFVVDVLELEGDWQNTLPFQRRVDAWIIGEVRERIRTLRRRGVNRLNNQELYCCDGVVAVGRTAQIQNSWEPCALTLLIYDGSWV